LSSKPQISVVLPVYNSEKYLAMSIDSVLKQTFSDFELIIINDGSRDKSSEIVKGFTDPRIFYYEQSNMGLAATLNKGIGLAKGEFIARMDNDDICYPERFEKQISCLQKNPEVGLLGTNAVIIDEYGQLFPHRFLKHPSDNIELKFALCFNNPFVHSSVMFRKDVFEKTGGYSLDITVFEDHNLWSKFATLCKVKNLPDLLLKYREVSTSMSRTTADYSQRVINQSVENIFNYCPEFSKSDISKAVAYINGYTDREHKYFSKKIKDILDALGEGILKSNRGFEKEIAALKYNYLKNYERHFLNSIIESDQSTALEILLAKIKRRVLFLTHSF
jgi:glycosyltransferase involved in cell wall biosynthesis